MRLPKCKEHSKENELSIIIEDINPYLIGVTESCAITDMSDAELGMPGYVMFRKDKIGRRGDGIIFYNK